MVRRPRGRPRASGEITYHSHLLCGNLSDLPEGNGKAWLGERNVLDYSAATVTQLWVCSRKWIDEVLLLLYYYIWTKTILILAGPNLFVSSWWSWSSVWSQTFWRHLSHMVQPDFPPQSFRRYHRSQSSVPDLFNFISCSVFWEWHWNWMEARWRNPKFRNICIRNYDGITCGVI